MKNELVRNFIAERDINLLDNQNVSITNSERKNFIFSKLEVKGTENEDDDIKEVETNETKIR